jgi:acetylornithine/succinyldiaminopimelate/putrescine aminotransferase
MNSALAERELTEPYLRGWLGTLGLDVDYVRAVGNTVYLRDADGTEVPVLDYVGGYGSLILGHNHPRLVAHAKKLLDAQIPVLAQFSRHPVANQVAIALNTIIQREQGTDEPYSAIFANSGAEAIEAAIKHAELDRVMRCAALRDEIATNVEQARAALCRGEAVVSDDAYLMADMVRCATEVDGFEKLVAELSRVNAQELARPSMFLALEGSFHGKLVGSVQLTHNPTYRAPFAAMAAQARFVALNQPEALARIVEQEGSTLLDVELVDGAVRLVTRTAPILTAFLVEPIQGEGGITVLSEQFAREIRQVCDAIGCPIVVDEVQSGMGRSGSFLASSRIGLRGDYYVLAKSLGGGLAKVSVLLVRQTRYRPEFEFVHSSTFAKDGFSCAIALEVLELLEADDGLVYQLAEERGTALISALRSVATEFPDVIKDVRGMGLMLGLEFQDQSASLSQPIAESAKAGLFGYMIAGFLLREHRIRIFPTASAGNTLRFEPSVYLTDEEIDLMVAALRDVCAVLRMQDGHRLIKS